MTSGSRDPYDLKWLYVWASHCLKNLFLAKDFQTMPKECDILWLFWRKALVNVIIFLVLTVVFIHKTLILYKIKKTL